MPCWVTRCVWPDYDCLQHARHFYQLLLLLVVLALLLVQQVVLRCAAAWGAGCGAPLPVLLVVACQQEGCGASCRGAAHAQTALLQQVTHLLLRQQQHLA